MRFLIASLLLVPAMESVAQALPCGPDNSVVSDIRNVNGALQPHTAPPTKEEFSSGVTDGDQAEEERWYSFVWESVKKIKLATDDSAAPDIRDMNGAPRRYAELPTEEEFRWGMTSTDQAEEAEEESWLSFVWESVKNLNFSSISSRHTDVWNIVGNVNAGSKPDDLALGKDQYRLRNVAEMQEVINEAGENADGLAAHSLLAANAWFYILFGNNAGSFENMNMEEYRKIGAMQAEEAASHLPDFEAELFAAQRDEATIEFGKSLSPAQRLYLFKLHSDWIAPEQQQ